MLAASTGTGFSTGFVHSRATKFPRGLALWEN